MKKILLFCLSISVAAGLSAQNDTITVTIPLEKWDELELERKTLIDSIKTLSDTLSHYRHLLAEDSVRIDNLTCRIDSLSLNISKLQERTDILVKDSVKFKDDSLRLHKEYQVKSEQIEAKLKAVEQKSGRADTIAIQMMITYLELKCSPKRIMELRHNYESIPNDTLKKDYANVDKILSLYSETRQEIIGLANEELSSGKIASADILNQDYYINIYMNFLNDLPYVKEYYKNEDWTSPYLNRMLDISYEALKTKDMSLLKEVIGL